MSDPPNDLLPIKLNIDYTVKVTSKNINRKAYELKFKQWDWIVANNVLKKPAYPQKATPQQAKEYNRAIELHQRALALLDNDYTIYAYAFLTWEGKPIKLHAYQDLFINDKHSRIDVEASNQIGKSFCLCVKAACNFLKNHGKAFTIGLLSKSMAQNSMNMRMIKQMLKNSSISYDPGLSDNMTVTTRNIYRYGPNGKTEEVLYANTLVCAVASTSALGFPFNDILLDEFEFWENPEGLEYMYKQVIEPRTFKTKGQITIFSNPNGVNYVSESLQKATLKEERDGIIVDTGIPQFHIYNFNFLDNPSNSVLEWEQQKDTTHPIIFASTMAAQRTTGGGAFLTTDEINDSFSSDVNKQGKYYGKGKDVSFFLDVGMVHDQSVLIGVCREPTEREGEDRFVIFYQHFYPVGYPLWRVIGSAPPPDFEKDDWEDKVIDNPSVKQIIEEYNKEKSMVTFGIDATGNAAVVPLCHSAGIGVIDVVFSGPKKWAMYQRFKTLMAKRLVKRGKSDNWFRSSNKNWEYQAGKLRIKKSQGGQYHKVHHENENDLDDAMDATVGALQIADNFLSTPMSFNLVSEEKKDDEDYYNDPLIQKKMSTSGLLF